MNTGISSLRRSSRRSVSSRLRQMASQPEATTENPLFYHVLPVRPERFHIRGQGIGGNRLAQLGKQRQVIVQVVDGVEPRAEDLVRALQVGEVGTAESAAGVARAVRIERGEVGAVTGVADL